jgi:hypothetical protein
VTNINEALETVRGHHRRYCDWTASPPNRPNCGDAITALSQIEARLAQAEAALRQLQAKALRREWVAADSIEAIARSYFNEEGA